MATKLARSLHMKTFCFAVCFLFSASVMAASAEVTGSVCVISDAGSTLNQAALNGTAASRTITLGPTVCGRPLESYKTLVIETNFSYAATGALTWTCLQGPTAARAIYKPTTCTTASGTCTLNNAGVMSTASLSASLAYGVRIGIQGYPVVKCVISHGGTPGATDTIDAFAIVSGN